MLTLHQLFLFLSSDASGADGRSCLQNPSVSGLGLGKLSSWLLDFLSAHCKPSVASRLYLGQEYQYPLPPNPTAIGPSPSVPTPTPTVTLEMPGHRKWPFLRRICLVPIKQPPCEQDESHTPPWDEVTRPGYPLVFCVHQCMYEQRTCFERWSSISLFVKTFPKQKHAHCSSLFFF